MRRHQGPHRWPPPKNRGMGNGCTSTRTVVAPTMGGKRLVAFATEMEGHTSILVRIIGVHAQSDRNQRCRHEFLNAVVAQSPNEAGELMRHHP